MRRLLSVLVTCALLVAGLAVPALAGTGWSSFDLGYADEDPMVASHIDKEIGARIERAWTHLTAGSRWNEATAGPFTLIRQDAELEYEQPGTGRVRISVTVTPRAAVPSESASSRALAERLLEILRSEIEASIASRRQMTVATHRGELRKAEAATKAAGQAVQHHLAEWGDLDTAREIATARLREASADLANTRIERAVTSHRLTAARKAVERAAEAEEIRAQADAIERTLEAEAVPADDPRRMALAELRARVRNIEKSAPPLVTARQRVFDMEVDLVGLEARESLLLPEVAELRSRTADLSVARRQEVDLRRTSDAARANEEKLASELRALERASQGPSVVVMQFRTSSR